MEQRKIHFILIVLLFLTHGVVTVLKKSRNNFDALTVKTNVGLIRGQKSHNGDYFMFTGIPYAKVDKENVFGPAIPHPKFENIFDASNDSAICPQLEDVKKSIVGTLDCLQLNIYVPNSASEENKLPVFVWIFGGQFAFGNPGILYHGPSALVRHDIIIVAVNYRLGPYGFMCVDIPEVPGNQGLKDQVLALRWIKNNVEAFGGDNNKITLAGASSGSMCVDLHAYYNQENLFQRVILQAGVALSKRVVKNPNPKVPFIYAEYFNYTPTDVQDALSFIGSLDSKQIIKATEYLGLSFKPCVEKRFHNVKNYITEHPINKKILILKDIEALIGFNSDDQNHIYETMDDDIFATSDLVGNVINANFNFDDDVDKFNEMKAFVESFYLGDGKMSRDWRRPIINMASDFSYYHPALRTVRKYLDSNVKSLYFYMFSYVGGRNIVKYIYNVSTGGAEHADELGYLFDFMNLKRPLHPEDALMMDRMTTLWTNFVKYGNPTPYVTELIPVKWPQVTLKKWNYLELDKELRIASRPFHHRMTFLDLLYSKYEQYQIKRQPQLRLKDVVVDITVPLFVIIVIYKIIR